MQGLSGKFLENGGLGSKFPLKNRKSGSRLPENRSKKRLKRQNSDGLSSVHLLAVSARRESIHSIGSGNAKKVLESLSRPRGEIGKHGRLKRVSARQKRNFKKARYYRTY